MDKQGFPALSLILVCALLVAGGIFLNATSGVQAEDQAAQAQEGTEAMKKDHLNKMQKYVTQHDGTEPAFDNEYLSLIHI